MSRHATAVVWDAFTHAEVFLTQPLLVVVADQVGEFGAYRDGREIFRVSPSVNKELVVVQGWSHHYLCDKPEPVS